ncbi:BON domain-containing protein [Aeromicrobium sp. CFBP 8757]|uniref:BON domain-containing protein n=1 Tax=Aeromicrobium sp. CFBP 8757 TaxID=2775288 RepID=UPI00177B09DB|nr:BON domain-containing protein [Aeromicrobium sp. CFBP 8757]
MKTTTTHEHDLQHQVEEALEWAPEIDSALVGISVIGSTVTLSGQVSSPWQKRLAARTAMRIKGVTSLANDLVVHHLDTPRTDTDVAMAASALIAWNNDVPDQSVKVTVDDHVVTLTGEVLWDYQRQAAHRAVEHLDGVRDVRNRISLTPRPHADAVETEAAVRRAIVRDASVDASHVHVKVHGSRITLTGHVASWSEKRSAAKAAWSSPHVDHVENRITVSAR